MASTDTKTPAAPIVTVEETTPKPAAAKPTAAQRRRAAKAAAQAKKDAPAVEAVAAEEVALDAAGNATNPIVEGFKGGATIATIARTVRKSQADVRDALDEAGVDYSADKNAKAPGAAKPASATPAAPKEWTLLGSYTAILAKKIDPKSKRGAVVADLAKREEDVLAIVADLSKRTGTDLAAAANAFTAALSAHYARVS